MTQAREIRKVGRLKTCGCIGSFDDNYASFKKYPQHANKECYYYLADVNDELIKPIRELYTPFNMESSVLITKS